MTWEELEQYCSSCTRCGLCRTRTKTVVGGGLKTAEIMLIAEAPGEQEDLQGRVFLGPAGQLLDKMLGCIGLDREKVYISNIVKCHPPRNRNPLPEEKDACLTLLRAQVRLVKPEIIVCLGRVAAQTVIDPQFRITAQHGTWVNRKGFWLTATYHPSALLRDPSKKRDSYEDLKGLRAKIDELDISL